MNTSATQEPKPAAVQTGRLRIQMQFVPASGNPIVVQDSEVIYSDEDMLMKALRLSENAVARLTDEVDRAQRGQL
jgi:hypothetical protein